MTPGRIDDPATLGSQALQQVYRELLHILVASEEALLTQKMNYEEYLGQFARRRALAEMADLTEREMRKVGIETRGIDRHRWRPAPKPERAK